MEVDLTWILKKSLKRKKETNKVKKKLQRMFLICLASLDYDEINNCCEGINFLSH